MSTATKPILSVTVSLEIEVEYDPFSGRTKQQFAESLQDDLHDALILWPLFTSLHIFFFYKSYISYIRLII